MKQKQLEKTLEELHASSFAWAVRCCFEDESIAKEVLHNTYLKILEGKAKYHGNSTFKTWLFAVIRFTAIDYHRAQKRQQTLPLNRTHNAIGNDNQAFPQTDQQLIFEKALQQLSPQQSRILHLVFYQNCTIQEAAEIMNIQLGTARTHYKRGKEHLKKWLIKSGLLEDIH